MSIKLQKQKGRKISFLFLCFSVSLFLSFSVFYGAKAATFDSDLLPGTTDTFDLGLSSTRWQNLYLSGNLNIGGSILLGNLSSDPSGGNGMIYYSSASSTFRAYQGGNWSDLGRWDYDSITGNIFNNNSGNIGIGTSNPSEKLEVAGTVQVGGVIMPTGAQNNYVLVSDAAGVASWQEPEVSLWALNGNNIYNSNSSNVGIGNTSPQEKLHISNGTLLIDNTLNPATLGADIATAKINNLTSIDINITENLDIDITSTLQIGSSLSVGVGGIFSNSNIEAGDFLKFGKSGSGSPAGSDCDSDSERGRITMDTSNNRLYICNGASRGWDYIALSD